MSDAPRTVLRPSPGTTPEQARDIRARAWAYIFGCYEKHKGASESNSTDTTRADNLHMKKGG